MGGNPPQYFTDDNSVKAIHTKCGHRIVFEDGDDSQIGIYTKDDKHSIILSLSDDGRIAINTEGTLLLKSKEMELSATNISVKADSDLKFTGGKIEMSADQEVKIKGTTRNYGGTSIRRIEGRGG